MPRWQLSNEDDAKTQSASVDFKFEPVKTEKLEIRKEPAGLLNYFPQFFPWMPLKKKYVELNLAEHPFSPRHVFFLQVFMSLLPSFTYLMMKGQKPFVGR